MLNSIPKNIQNMSSLHEVKVHGNEFICNSENMWMKDWILNNTDFTTDYKKIVCIKSGDQPIPIIKINKAGLGCIPGPEAFAVWKIIGNHMKFVLKKFTAREAQL